MLIGTYGPIRIPCKLGYMQLLNPTLYGVKIMYGGYLGDWSEDIRRQMLEHLYTSLCNGNGDVARFEQVPQHSELYAWLRTHPPIWCRSHFPKSDKHWQMDIPNQMEAFFEHHSSKTRQTLKRYMRKLEKDHQVCILECLDVKSMSDVLPKAEAISQKTYQHALGWGFVNDVQTRHQLEVAAQSGWLRFHVLLLDEIPCAFQYGFCCQGTYYLKTMGFDPEYGKLHAGTVLFLKIIEKLCRDPETDCFDFGYGDAEYKRRFGNVQWDEATVYIYARRFYPMLVNLIHGTIRAVSVGMRWIVHKTGSEGRIKQLWRRLLRKNN